MKTLLTLLFGVAAIGAFLVAPRSARAGEIRFASHAGQRTSLIELYTSEGCSSCPPADAWLSRLGTNLQLWTAIVPVAFHVDYWDNLGWRDRFATRDATARQQAYAAAWGGDSVYTPGLVLDGHEWRQWSSFAPGILPPATRAAGAPGDLVAVVKDDRTVAVTYRAGEQPAGGAVATVALLGCDLNSNVKAGENSGRQLRHDFVVLGFESKKLNAGSVTFALPKATADATKLALAAWIEAPGHAGILQATGGWLPGINSKNP